jgi:hypothetical protein
LYEPLKTLQTFLLPVADSSHICDTVLSTAFGTSVRMIWSN